MYVYFMPGLARLVFIHFIFYPLLYFMIAALCCVIFLSFFQPMMYFAFSFSFLSSFSVDRLMGGDGRISIMDE